MAIILKEDLAKFGYDSKKTFNCPSISLATQLKPNISTNFWQSLLFFYPCFFYWLIFFEKINSFLKIQNLISQIKKEVPKGLSWICPMRAYLKLYHVFLLFKLSVGYRKVRYRKLTRLTPSMIQWTYNHNTLHCIQSLQPQCPQMWNIIKGLKLASKGIYKCNNLGPKALHYWSPTI